MSRPHFMPLLAPESAARSLGLRSARSARSAAPAAEVGRPAGRSPGPVTCLGVTSSPERLQDGGVADAILRRVLSCGCPVGTVVLDLGAATAIEPRACVAILTLHERLAALGTRLRLAASARAAAVCLADEGVTQHIGRDAVHPSFRSAVLATYAALPGPGLVMGRVKAALETEAEVIAPLAREAARRSPPASASSPAKGGAARPGPAVDCDRPEPPQREGHHV